MPWVITKYVREKLYEEVWTDPVVAVAKRYGISDVGLRKICKRLGVPLPPAGHWAKVYAGQKVTRPKLPNHKGETTYSSNRYVDDSPEAEPAPEPEAVTKQKAFEALPENRIVVRGTLDDAHRFVRATERGFRKPQMGGNGVIPWPRGKCVLDIAVSTEHRTRALLLMDALLTAMKARGFKVYAQPLTGHPDSDYKHVYLEVLGERLGLRLIEKTRREERALTDDEKAKQRRDKLFRPLAPWTYYPTGLFSLVILDEYRRDRTRISDRKNGIRLEEQLNQVVVSIVAEAAKQQHQRQVTLENRQRAELEMRERWERQRVREGQLRLLDKLEQQALKWERAGRLRAYANSMEKLAIENGHDLKAETSLSERLEWIRHKADWLDPMVASSWPEVDDV
jgi:hypothetical protein